MTDALPRSQDVALRWLDEGHRVIAATLIETARLGAP
jgi:hypothetical protein